MKNIFKSALCFLAVFTSMPAFSQPVEMADQMRADGKIYVVVAIVLLVLAGLILYLFFMDRKLNKMEKQLNEKGQTKS